jgi:hypothetical protein
MPFTTSFDTLPSIFATAVEEAQNESNLFVRMDMLQSAYRAQLGAEFKGKPDTAYTRAEIAARTNAMAREIIVRGLLQRHA